MIDDTRPYALVMGRFILVGQMADAELEKMERAAAAVATRLSVQLVVPDDVGLKPNRADGAGGKNSLKEEFLGRLERGEHLNDDFLADG